MFAVIWPASASTPVSKPGFVEVLSEQGLGLLYFDLQQETLDVPAPRLAAVDLSDGRQLSVSLTLVGGAPVIDVSYYDPLLDVGVDSPRSARAPLTNMLGPGLPETRRSKGEVALKTDSWPSRFISDVRRARPWIIAIAVGLCVLIGLGLAHTRLPGTARQQATAATILAQSLKQTARAVPPHGAVHETFSLEIRSGQGATIGIPLDGMLRGSPGAYSGLSGAELDEHIREAAREIVARSARVHRAAWVVRQIGSKDFRGSELARMSVQDRQLWLALLASPLMTCNAELHAIDVTVTGERKSVPLPQQDTDPIRTVRDLAMAADSLGQNAERLDRLLMAGFAVSPEVSFAPVSPAELLQELAQVQREESRLALTVQRLQQGSTNTP